ncbi:MAG TPA: hypothetical protein VKS21_08320, partial [Spirochaetota bacterium]|nr:hypothetical protein [Spirochaetota bacterium]
MKQTIDLSGQWTLRTGNNKINIKTRVPTMVHPALEKAGLIPNPFYRDNEKNLQWISCEDWIFERRFNCPAGFYKYQEIKLNCTGLDTFAEITVNNQKVGHSDNMFRPWQFSVKNFLQPGQNKISVKFKSVLPYMQQQEQKRHLKSVKNCLYEPDGRSWVRKMQCNFGWDWGPVLITAGIFDRIFLETCHSVKIDDLYTEQQHSRNRCKLTVHTRIKNSCSRAYALKTELLDPAGKNIYSHTSYTHNLKNKLDINIKNPQLWWVNGLGGQPLYTLINKL